MRVTGVPQRRLLLLAAGVLGLVAATPAHAGGALKAGGPFAPQSSVMLDERALASGAATHALVALEGPAGAALVRRAGGVLLDPELRLWRVRAGPARPLIGRLASRGVLRYAEVDGPLFTPLAAGNHRPGDPLTVPFQQEHELVGADRVEPPPFNPVRRFPLTVLDTGFDATHPEFANRPNTTYLNAQSLSDGPADAETHGTKVASVAAAPVNGIGMVGIFPAAILQLYDVGAGAYGDCAAVVVGLRRAREAAPRGVVNISLGYPINDRRCRSFYEAVQVAFGGGSIVVAAAGNERQEGNPEESPANLNHVLTVAATSLREEPAGFSNSNYGIDLAAPGEDILVAVPRSVDPEGYGFSDGTSFAAPIVAGATAWVWTERPNLDTTQIFNLMRYSARDIWREGFDPDTGFGMLDIPSALTEASPISDHQEPNDDIDQVKAGGLFTQAATPLTSPGRSNHRLRALLDGTEDPADVYRVWVRGRSQVTVTLKPDNDVDLELYSQRAKTIYWKRRAAALRSGGLLDYSVRSGSRSDVVRFVNSGRGGKFVYVCAYLPRGSARSDARYTLSIRTTR